jgi:hypothetical protein
MEDASVRNDGIIPIAVAVNEFLMNFLRWLAIRNLSDIDLASFSQILI